MFRVIKVCIVLVIIVFTIMKNQTLYNIIGYRFVGFLDGTESSAAAREYYSDLAIEYIKKKPFKGYGINTFREINIFGNWTESNYLELAFGGGIQLAVYYYGYLLFLVYKLFKLRKKDKIYGIFMLILLLIVSADIVSMSYLGRLEALIITISSVLCEVVRKELKESEKNMRLDVNI